LIIVDTGVLVAANDADDYYHDDCVELLTIARGTGSKLVVPATVLAEAGYLIERQGGAKVEAAFLRSLRGPDFEIATITENDLDRMANLVEQYSKLGLGTTDASIIAISERLRVTQIATIDRKHFSVVNPTHTKYYTLLP